MVRGSRLVNESILRNYSSDHIVLDTPYHAEPITQQSVGPDKKGFSDANIHRPVCSNNHGLCGFPLANNCSTQNNSVVEPGEEIEHHTLDVIWIVCSAVIGFITGFWVFRCLILDHLPSFMIWKLHT
jgi:hypothetical protein